MIRCSAKNKTAKRKGKLTPHNHPKQLPPPQPRLYLLPPNLLLLPPHTPPRSPQLIYKRNRRLQHRPLVRLQPRVETQFLFNVLAGVIAALRLDLYLGR